MLEKLVINFEDYKSMDTLNYMLLKDNNLKSLIMIFYFEDTGEDVEKMKIYEMDFSYIKNLKKLNHLEMTFQDDNNGKIIPKNLIKGLNELEQLETFIISKEGNCKIEDINKIRINSLKKIDIFLEDYDIKTILENNNNLTDIKFFYLEDEENIKFPKNLEKINLSISSDKILFQLFKQIQAKSFPLIELTFRVEWIIGKLKYDTLEEMAKCFKLLPNLKKLNMQFIIDKNDKRNTNWIKNIKFLKNLNYFQIMYYDFTIDELELFLQSIQNLEYLYEIIFYDNCFEGKKVTKLLSKYKLPPILKKFNIWSQCIDSDEEEDSNFIKDEYKSKKKTENKKDKNPIEDFDTEILRKLYFLINHFKYPDLE